MLKITQFVFCSLAYIRVIPYYIFMNKIQKSALTPVEQDIVSRKHTKAVSIFKGKRISEIVKAFGACESPSKVRITMEDGTVVVPTIMEEIIYNAMKQELDNPRGFATILDMQKVMGENKEEINVNVSLVDEDLMKRAMD